MTTITKSDIAAKLAEAGKPLTQSEIKKASHADLRAMLDQFEAINMEPAFSTKRDTAKPKTTKAARVFNRAPGKAEDIKPVRSGTKREAILTLLCGGATAAQVAELCVKADGSSWTKAARRAACTTWACSLGYGIEQHGDKFHLVMPAGIRSVVTK